MKKIFCLLLLSGLLIWSTVGAYSAGIWSKYVAADKSYSFHYPSGWKVTENTSIVGIENSRTDEQLMMAMIPFNDSKSPQDLAKEFLVMLKEGNPNVRGSNWQSQSESAGTQVIFDLTDKSNGKEYSGLGIVIKAEQQATWFSYLAPTAGHSQARASNILQGFISSLAVDSTSKAPVIDYNIKESDNINLNAKSFLFVLEFALGAPLTKTQEDMIINELKNSWRTMSKAELQKYNEYPTLVQTILKMGQKDIGKLRAELEKSIKNWLEESDQSDQVVKIIRNILKNRGRVVIAGNPPLTDMSLTAYSEIIAFSRLLQKNPKAMVEQISQKSVDEIKKQVKKVWGTFSINDRKDIATTPGLWICQRMLLQKGSQVEQNKIRVTLTKLGTVTRDIVTNNNENAKTNKITSSKSQKPTDMTTHWCLMQMQQQTFNTFMWSQGFNYLPATGKVW